jgi:DNA-binding MarR family transcriptional regulator
VGEKEELFLKLKPARILVQINDPQTGNYTSKVAREVDCTYSHAVRIIQRLEEQGLVETEKEGRKKMLKLTAPGQQIAETLSHLMHQLRHME